MRVFNIFGAVLCLTVAHSKCIPDDYVVAYNYNRTSESLPLVTTVRFSELKSANKYDTVLFTGQATTLCKEFGDAVKHLRGIKLYHMLVTSIDKGIFDGAALQHITLETLQMPYIENGVFQNMPKLAKVFFYDIAIMAVEDGAFKNLPSLKEFSITLSMLTTVDPKWFENCPKLHRIDLSHNDIRELRAGAFSFLVADQPHSINLQYNKIRTIEPNAFSTKKFLLLDLEGNHLKQLSSSMFPEMIRGKYVNLEGNRFNCIDEKTLSALRYFDDVNLKHNYPDDGCDKRKVTKALKRVLWT